MFLNVRNISVIMDQENMSLRSGFAVTYSHSMRLHIKCDWFVLQFGNSGGPLINLVSQRSCLNVGCIITLKCRQTCSDCCGV